MAPRETKIKTESIPRLSGEAAARLMETLKSQEKAPYKGATATGKTGGDALAKGVDGKVTAGKSESKDEPIASMAKADAYQQAEALKSAAKEGVPFCEECEKAKKGAAAA